MSQESPPPSSTGSPAAVASRPDAKSFRAQLVERSYLLIDKAIDQGWQATMRLAVLLAVLGAIVVAVTTVARG
jgi:hypothetical protein